MDYHLSDRSDQWAMMMMLNAKGDATDKTKWLGNYAIMVMRRHPQAKYICDRVKKHIKLN